MTEISHLDYLWTIQYVIRVTYDAALSHPFNLAISSGWIIGQCSMTPGMTYHTTLCNPDDLAGFGTSPGWVTANSSRWYMLPHWGHTDEILNFHSGCFRTIPIYDKSYAKVKDNFCFSDRQEFCHNERFLAECGSDEVILMTLAQYGRMALGRCVKKDYGYIGCGTDVIDIAHAYCSGRRTCEIAVPNAILDALEQPCPEDFKSYLKATYNCQRGRLNFTNSLAYCSLLSTDHQQWANTFNWLWTEWHALNSHIIPDAFSWISKPVEWFQSVHCNTWHFLSQNKCWII